MSKGFGELNVARAAMAWARGWTLTRNKAFPVSQRYGCKIDLGLPERLERHVVADFDLDILHELTGSLHTAGTWLKVCAHPEQVIPLLHENWEIQAPEFLMGGTL